MTLAAAQVADALAQYERDGYAIVRGFLPADEVAELQSKTAELYSVAMEHPVTYRHGNLAYEVLPEQHFGQRYVIQAYSGYENKVKASLEERIRQNHMEDAFGEILIPKESVQDKAGGKRPRLGRHVSHPASSRPARC